MKSENRLTILRCLEREIKARSEHVARLESDVAAGLKGIAGPRMLKRNQSLLSEAVRVHKLVQDEGEL
jgi:hypothetical protein